MKIENKNPALMEPDEIIQEIKNLRGDMERSATRLYELSRVLYTKARRDPDVDRTPSRILFANAWGRFSGAVGQGLRRASSADRVLEVPERERQDREERDRREEARKVRQEAREHKRNINPSLIPSDGVEDLVELFGQEVVNHAT